LGQHGERLVAEQTSECKHGPTSSVCDIISLEFGSEERKFYSLKVSSASKSLSKFVTMRELRDLRACM
jgi:hypothetical protein